MEQDRNKDTDWKRNASSLSRRSASLSLGRKGSRSSWRSNSSSLSQDVGDRILQSLSLSRELAGQMLEDVDSSMIAQVGDSGDRVTISDRGDENESLQFSMDDSRIVENGFQFVSPVAEEMTSPLPTDAMIHSTVKNEKENEQSSLSVDKQYKLPQILDYISYLIHLALFGILGVICSTFLYYFDSANSGAILIAFY